MRSTGKPYAEIIGLDGIEAYALNAAVVRWGTAFDAAVQAAVADAKNRDQAESRAEKVLRKWVPSTRRYR